MTQNRDFFTPESVDEQVEQFSSRQSAEPAHPEPDGAPAQAEMRHVRDFPTNEDGQDAPERLVKELRAFYQADYEQNKAALSRAKRRIAAHQFAPYDVNQARNPMDFAPVLHFSQDSTRKMQSPHSMELSGGRRQSRSLSLLAAVLAIGLLVSTLAVVLTLGHNQQGRLSLGGATSTPTPIGTILFAQKSPAGTYFGSAAWSPDGTRIAVPAIDSQTFKVQQLDIWNAASKKKLQTIHLDPKGLEQILWSPTGKYLALDNSQTIVIVDSQSDTVVKTINYSALTTSNALSTSLLSWRASNVPLSSGFGFYSMAWSPDGTSLAVAVSDMTTGRVVLLDPQTGAVKTTFSQQARTFGLSMSFSNDGKYLAVSYPNDSTIVVWDVATQNAVFMLNGAQSLNIAWQPGTHNLTRETPTSVELWDVNAQKLLKTYKESPAFAWSPDGKELAEYNPASDPPPTLQAQTKKVTILNADTGAQVGLYTSQNQMVLSASWSPDGRSIATNEASDLYASGQIVIWAA